MGHSQKPLPHLILVFLIISTFTVRSGGEEGFISIIISEKGLGFIKDLVINEAVRSLTTLRLPVIERSIRIPLIGSVHATLSNITISDIDVPSSTIKTGEEGVVMVASNVTVNMSMDWRYSYATWLIPIEVSDRGSATIWVDGMEVGVSVGMEIQEGTLKLSVKEFGCYLEDISINLEGGASWFYQGFVDAFEAQIRSSVETTITNKVSEGTMKLDSFLQNLPKEVQVDDVSALNVTLVNDPLLGDSFIGFEVNGLFTAKDEATYFRSFHTNFLSSISYDGPSEMLVISLDEAVFNSASTIYFKAGLMHRVVDKVPDQSYLNTARWRYIIPQLYKKYPNDDMKLNISLSSPPIMRITSHDIGATIYSDMTVDVVDGYETVSVACISIVATASGVLEVSGNNLAGQAELDDFSLELKWSNVGDFHMTLIQSVMRALLKTVVMPFLNLHLKKGFPLPIIHGFTIQNAAIQYSNSKIMIYSNVEYIDSFHDHLKHPLALRA
ncbi:putative BPI/LBP family protein [Acorus gramineus]|uniref:BPI/LBP family protein n=1 Tax=Acorus gramineus TaxID=55184 RepID=A0AAV9BAH4_ACOGR|nr:putative BPI/LBP family protein [Acorus gramineus]